MAKEPEHKESDMSFHRSMAGLKKGGLHRALGIDPNEKIPKDRVKEAKNSDNPHVRSMAVMADNMSHWK